MIQDVSAVTNYRATFAFANVFNQDISSWVRTVRNVQRPM